MPDIAILGGHVIDGTGSPQRRADVIIHEGRITRISPASGIETATHKVTAKQTIDASDCVITPGFIDLHTHADFRLLDEPYSLPSLSQGVTTVATGNCGWSTFPYDGTDTLHSFTSTFGGNQNACWPTLKHFSASLNDTDLGVNVAPMIGHASIRLSVVGPSKRSTLTKREMSVIRSELERAIDSGVFGLTTGLIYAPGSFADQTELIDLIRVAADNDLLYSTHMRNESDELLDSVYEALTMAERTGVRLQISHLKSMGPRNHGRIPDALQVVKAAKNDGLDVAFDVYPYSASSTTLTSRLPSWSLDGGPMALVSRLKEPQIRSQIRTELSFRWGRDVDPAAVIMAEDDPALSGLSLVDLATKWGVNPSEAALRVLEEKDGVVPVINHAMSESDVEMALKCPLSAIASDGWVMSAGGTDNPHPRSFGTYVRFLQKYVLSRKLIGLEDAIYKITALPASRLGITDRGVVAEGNVADLAIFNPSEVRDNSSFEHPRRLASGVRHVLIGGQLAIESGEHVGVGRGRVLEKTR